MRWICAEMAKQYGMGLRASALLAGYSDLHAKLESKLATLTHKESALLFPTGISNDTFHFCRFRFVTCISIVLRVL